MFLDQILQHYLLRPLVYLPNSRSTCKHFVAIVIVLLSEGDYRDLLYHLVIWAEITKT